VGTLSGGEQKRLVLESLLRGNDGVLLLDEPDNYLDVPGKRWLEQQLASTPKTVLLVSHDRELLAACAQRIVTVEDRHVWVHGGGFGNLRPGPRRPDQPARGTAPPLGRGAREAERAGPHLSGRRPRTTTAWPPGCRPR
jgi:energy-coupling factor transporter ATP-binding protein EcfA2